MGDPTRGIYRKFEVRRTDGSSAPGKKHDGCAYFVLDLTHDKYAGDALRAYADACEAEYPLLADDLRDVCDGLIGVEVLTRPCSSPPPGETQEAAYPTPWAYKAACKALEKWRARANVLQAALLACCRERCPACPGKEGSHDDRCWLGTVLEGTPGPAYDAACAAILEKAK